MPKLWTPEDDFRRCFPKLGDRLDRLPLDEIAQYALEIERELQGRESLRLTVERGDGRSKANLILRFPYGEEIEYMLLASRVINGPQSGWWRALGFSP